MFACGVMTMSWWRCDDDGKQWWQMMNNFGDVTLIHFGISPSSLCSLEPLLISCRWHSHVWHSLSTETCHGRVSNAALIPCLVPSMIFLLYDPFVINSKWCYFGHMALRGRFSFSFLRTLFDAIPGKHLHLSPPVLYYYSLRTDIWGLWDRDRTGGLGRHLTCLTWHCLLYTWKHTLFSIYISHGEELNTCHLRHLPCDTACWFLATCFCILFCASKPYRPFSSSSLWLLISVVLVCDWWRGNTNFVSLSLISYSTFFFPVLATMMIVFLVFLFSILLL